MKTNIVSKIILAGVCLSLAALAGCSGMPVRIDPAAGDSFAYQPPAENQTAGSHPDPAYPAPHTNPNGSSDPASPYPPPVPTPEGEPVCRPVTWVEEPSVAAQASLQYILDKESIPAECLAIIGDHPTEYVHLGRKFQVVTLLDVRPYGDEFDLLVDLDSGEIIGDLAAMMDQEDAARFARYGKLDPDLFDHLEKLAESDVVKVALWAATGPGQRLDEREAKAVATLAAKYPEAKAAVAWGGKPMDVEDRELAERIYAEYVEIVEAGATARLEPLMEALKGQGISFDVIEGMPMVFASLSKAEIQLIAKWEEVGQIELAEGGERNNP